jgi:hypothetical protein
MLLLTASPISAGALIAYVLIGRVPDNREIVLPKVRFGNAYERTADAPRPPARIREFPNARPSRERPRAHYDNVLLVDVPHVKQKPDFCGEACVAMWLNRLGHAVDQDFVYDQSGLDPLEGRGCYTRELARALRALGFEIGKVWYDVPLPKLDASLEALWSTVHSDLMRDVPTIVCTHYDERPITSEHFRLIVGYDDATDEVIYHEPAARSGAYRRMPREKLFALWPLPYDEAVYTVIALPLAGDPVVANPVADVFTDADYAQHMMQLRSKVPSDDFTVVIQRPFVVVGDDPATTVRGHAEGTIQWAIERLQESYFEKEPTEILDIWLFKDRDSYATHTAAVFNDRNPPFYGYFSHYHRALVMNIDTGTGTLVHEIVHPFMAANFPECPAWFNEGLASLYEQCHTANGRIEGLTNWRLEGLQELIREEEVPPFAELCATSDWGFYRAARGNPYAQARYLCYYLEQHNLLREYFRRFRENCAEDPTGYETLKEVLGRDDMEAWQEEWQEYVMELTFP